MLPGFQPAPSKFVTQLDEASEQEPVPAFVAQYLAGEKYINHKRRSELAAAAGAGALAGGGVMLFSWIALIAAAAIVLSVAAIYALSAYKAHFESKAGIIAGEKNIMMLDQPIPLPEEKQA